MFYCDLVGRLSISQEEASRHEVGKSLRGVRPWPLSLQVELDRESSGYRIVSSDFTFGFC
jgi:hypothetical protein